MSAAPPPKPPKPGKVKVVRALYKYEAQYPDELSFDEGDILYITECSVTDPNWLRAKCGTRVGLVPCNYIDENVEFLESPMHDACKRGNVSFLEEAIASGVSVNNLDKAGNTPLYWAAHGGHTSCMNLLLQSPIIELNVQNKLGDTPLHAAAWKSRKEAVALLLTQGALVNIPNNDGKTPCALASDPEVIDLLRKHAMEEVSADAEYLDSEEDERDSD